MLGLHHLLHADQAYLEDGGMNLDVQNFPFKVTNHLEVLVSRVKDRATV